MPRLPFSRRRLLPVIACLLGASASVPAQTYSNGWQSQLDLLSSGAAASVVLYLVCVDLPASKEAATWANWKLTEEVTRLSQQAAYREVYAYAFEAADIKVKALAQSTQGQGCGQLDRLRSMARARVSPLPSVLALSLPPILDKKFSFVSCTSPLRGQRRV